MYLVGIQTDFQDMKHSGPLIKVSAQSLSLIFLNTNYFETNITLGYLTWFVRDIQNWNPKASHVNTHISYLNI